MKSVQHVCNVRTAGKSDVDETASPLILAGSKHMVVYQLGAGLAEKYMICFECLVLLPFS